ncbi:MAG: AbgT family transporter [Planctomycetaceae bacterium]|jgi:aminobenzoyl-glutamate transport protein|nr:AbgT family transporter [Planctomycetaceae bacterium]
MQADTASRGPVARLLSLVERVGNRLPDPATLFVLLGVAVLVLSLIGAKAGWSVADPRDPAKQIVVDNLLDADGIRWMLTGALRNFLDFPPLAIVLVAMLGIGVAERTGLFTALIKLLVSITPSMLLTPALVFIGVCSNIASDAGYVVLPPLAAGMFAMVGRSPLVAIAAVTFGVAGGFSANVAISSLDPLLSSLTEGAARAIDPNAVVQPTCNYYFMLASTPFLTLVGWFVTARIVEPRFGRADIDAQIAEGGAERGRPRLTAEETRGLVAATLALVVVGGLFLAMALAPGWPLSGEMLRPGTTSKVPVWSEAIVPMILLLFLAPGVAYGLVSREIRSDRCVARRMGDSMSSMGTYLVLAFFAGQTIAWFKQSNLTSVLGVTGGEAIKAMGFGEAPMLAAIVVVVTLINLFVSSASAKWAFLAPILVPMLGAAGMSPELVQCAYRVGDSCTNPIAPLSPYLVVVLIAIQRYQKSAGLGTLIALLVPYTIVALVAWTGFLLVWNAAGWPLGF